MEHGGCNDVSRSKNAVVFECADDCVGTASFAFHVLGLASKRCSKYSGIESKPSARRRVTKCSSVRSERIASTWFSVEYF